jgi:DNA adenine methylase
MKKIEMVYYQHGSKSNLTDWIISHFPKHDCYVEPFFGSGIVFFRKPRSKVEIVNDLNYYIYNLYKVIQSDAELLKSMIYFTPFHQNYCKIQPNGDEIYDAWWAITKRFMAYRGNENNSTFALGYTKSKGYAWTKLAQRIQIIHERLQGVQILCDDAVKVIKRIKDKDVFCYCDPPYFGHEEEYVCNLESYDEFVREITNIKGKVMISEEEANIDRYPAEWVKRVERREVRKSLSQTRNEVLLMNY